MKRFYVKTDEGLELVECTSIIPQLDPRRYAEYQLMYPDSVVGQGNFCYDYVSADASKEELIEFLDRNLDR
jgi:hypothetical protein